MKLVAMLVMPAVLLAAAETLDPRNGQRMPDTSYDQSGVHVNRHVDAHVPARVGEQTGTEPQTRRKSPADPFAGSGARKPPPSAMQPARDRR